MKASRIPADFPVQPVNLDQMNIITTATCMTCKLSWDDSISTALTPTPAGRCPFEGYHEPEEECENCGRTDHPLVKNHCDGCRCRRCGKTAGDTGGSMSAMGWCPKCEDVQDVLETAARSVNVEWEVVRQDGAVIAHITEPTLTAAKDRLLMSKSAGWYEPSACIKGPRSLHMLFSAEGDRTVGDGTHTAEVIIDYPPQGPGRADFRDHMVDLLREAFATLFDTQKRRVDAEEIIPGKEETP